jgi:hypothetical protein
VFSAELEHVSAYMVASARRLGGCASGADLQYRVLLSRSIW